MHNIDQLFLYYVETVIERMWVIIVENLPIPYHLKVLHVDVSSFVVLIVFSLRILARYGFQIGMILSD